MFDWAMRQYPMEFATAKPGQDRTTNLSKVSRLFMTQYYGLMSSESRQLSREIQERFKRAAEQSARRDDSVKKAL